MTSYNLPGVTLTQIEVQPSNTLNDAELYETLVGPLYRVIKNSIVYANANFPNNLITITNPLKISYPKLDPGAIVDLSSIVITIKNGILELLAPATGAVGFVSGQDTFTDTNTDFIASGVKAGDKVVVGDYNSLNGEYIVKTVNQHSLVFTYAIFKTFTGTDTGYKINRSIDSWLLATTNYTATSKEITINSVSNGTKNFIAGEIDLSYRALRKDKTGLVKYESLDEVVADMEVDYVDNKLGYYIKNAIIVGNGSTTAFYVYILSDDSDTAYLNALEDLASHEETYILVSLSNSSVVKNAYTSHVSSMSQPDESKFRIFFQSTSLTTKTLLGSGSVTLK